jgi:GDPmannose 4,6-dehydratase
LKIVLITGALGQDGIILSKIFLKKKFKVFGIIRKKKKKIVPKVKYILNNLKSKEKIDKILKKVKPSIIIHLAATNNSYSFKNKENFKNNYLLNLIYTKNLINSAVEINSLKKFIFAGSSLMFKNQKKITVTEKSNFGSKDYYSKYKIDSFNYIQKKSKIYDFDSTTVLLFNHDSVYRNKKFLIPRLVKAFIRKDKNLIEKIFSFNISGDFSHAEDICNGIFSLSTSNKRIPKIILSSGKRFYINDIINYLAKIFSIEIKKKSILKKTNYKHLGSNNLAKKLIKFKNEKTIFEVVDQMIQKKTKD